MKKLVLALSFLAIPVAAFADGGAGVEIGWLPILGILFLIVVAMFVIRMLGEK